MRKLKKAAVLFAMIMACFAVFAATTSYDSAVREIVDTFVKVLGTNTAVSFVSVETDSEGFRERFVSDVERNLINNDCTVLDRSNLDAIVAELKFQTSGLVDEDQAVSIGHMLGAKMIIAASAKNMVSSYHVDIQLIDVETTLVKRHLVFDLDYDSNLMNIIKGSTKNVGSQKIGIGVRGGASIEFNKAHEDMVGTTVRPAEKSPIGIVPTLSFFYRATETLKLQLEASFFMNNGIKVIGFYDEYTSRVLDIDVKYSTLDIPVLVSWTFIRRPMDVNVFGGAYASIPLGTANITYDIEDYGTLSGAVDITGVVFGVVGGFDFGFRIGPGNLVIDVRAFYDLKPSKAKGEIIGPEPQGLIYRRGAVVSAGYVFYL